MPRVRAASIIAGGMSYLRAPYFLSHGVRTP
jgi:hypothetical protein